VTRRVVGVFVRVFVRFTGVVTDQNLKSERTDALEFGIDLETLLNNRLNFDIDLYDYSTTNQILCAN
jgi:hypothetical protein